MGLLDFLNFKKSSDVKNNRAEHRSKVRDVERGMDKISEQIQRLEKEKADLWARARAKVVQGLKQDAARLLQQYKQKEVMIAQLSKQVSFIDNTKTNIEVAQITNEAMNSINDMIKTADIDPNKMDAIMADIENTNYDIQDVNKVVDTAMKKQEEQLNRMYSSSTEDVNTDDQLMAQLMRETIGGSSYSVDTGSADDSEINEGLRKIQEELK